MYDIESEMSMRILFMGTPEFSVPALRALHRSGHQVVAVVTQPDRIGGRHRHTVLPPPVKVCAEKLGLTVVQPESVRDRDVVEFLEALAPDLIVTIAFGQMLPSSVLQIPAYCCVNAHASLLPKYRGAAPINWALINGESETGVTIIRMNEQMDAGDIILAEKVLIAPEETADELSARLSRLAAKLLVRTLDAFDNGTVEFQPQPDGATFAPKLTKADGVIDWNKSAHAIVHHIRGVTSWPGAQTTLMRAGKRAQRILIRRATVHSDAGGEPGIIVEINPSGIVVGTGEGSILIKELVPAGKKQMKAAEFARGARIRPGDRFEAPDI